MSSYKELSQMVKTGQLPEAVAKPAPETISTEEKRVSTPYMAEKLEREQLRVPVGSATRKQDRQRRQGSAADLLARAKWDYDNYIQSDEYRQNMAAADQKARLDALMTATITGSSDTMTQPIQDKKEQELRALVDHYTAQVQQEESQRLMAADLQELDTWEEADRAALETYIINRNTDFANKLNPMLDPGAGTAVMGASSLIQKYGLKRVNEMAESLSRSRNAEITQQAAQAAQAGADEGAWSALGHNAASVPVGAVGGLTGLFGYVQELGERSGRYPTMDPNNMGNLPSVYAGAVRGQTAQNIEESVGGVGGKIASLGYQGVMSMADSYARLVLGGGAAGGTALAATNTFAQTMSEASARGATPGQAALLATTKAGIEALSEKIPLDKLVHTAKSGGQGLKNAVIDAFAQAGVEIATEEVSLFGSVLAEAAILREKSAYANASWEDLLMEAAETAAVSGISGGLSSAGASAVGNVMAPAANPQQNPQIAAENAAPVKAEPEAAVTPEEAAEQLGRESPKAEPVQKTEGELGIDRAYEATVGIEQQKTAAPEEATVTVRSAGVSPLDRAVDPENDQKVLAHQLATNMNTIQDMESVSQLTGREFGKTGDNKKISDKLRDFFKSIGNKVARSGFGEVELGEYAVGAFLTHRPINRARAVSVAAAPDVIKNGRQIGYEANWKGRGYPSYVFAAPVDVAGSKVYVAAVVNQAPDNKFYLSEMIDSEGNYVRIEESSSGNSKNGLPMGPDNQQGRDYARPEELSKGSSPSAEAEPMPLSENIVPQQRPEVNGNIDESRAQGVDGQEQSAEGGQDTGDGLGAVGAAASRFRHEVKTSKVYGNTYRNANDPDVFASGIDAQQNNPRIAQYDVITEEESLHEAELRSATGRDRYVEYKYLMKKDGWTGADNDTAMKLLTAFRKEGKTDRFNELARKQRKLSTDAGQFIQSFAKYSRSDATVAVLDAVEVLDKLEMDQVDKKRWKQPKKGTVGQADDYSDRAVGDMAALKQENTPRSKRRQNKEDFQKWKDSVTKSMLEIANDIENVEEGDAASMRDIVRQLAQYRRTTAWMGNSSNLTKNADRILTKMDFDTAKTMAKSQLAMIPNDFRKRSTGEVVKAVRIQNMLSALTTTSRNLAGNATTGLMDAVSDSTGGQLMDAILSRYTGKRTVGTDVKYAGEYLRAARDAADMASLCVELDIPMDSEAAYSTGKTRTFRANGSVVERFMSSYEKYLKYSLEVTDKFFEGGTKGAVSKSLADLGAKTGLTEEQIQGLAQKAGERRTFKEGRKLAQLNTGFKKGLNLLGKGDFGAGDILIPFAGVPGDVIQTGIDYSGIGLIEGLFEAHKVIKAARNEKKEIVYEVDGKKVKVPIEQAQRKAASDFGRGATGALLIAVFTAASVAGLIKVHNDEDRDKRALDQSQGLSGAQLNLDGLRRGLSGESTEWLPDDELVSIDFLEPFNSQMYIGAMMAEAEDWKDVASAPFRGILSAVLDMPMVQTASDIAELATSLTEVSEDGNMDAVEDAWGQLLGNTMTGFIPSWMRQAAQTIDPIYRDTSGANAMEKAKNQFLAAVPFASKTLPAKYDGLGNEQRRYDNVWEGFLDNFVTPWTTTTLKGMPVNDKLRELSDSTGDDSIYPEYQAPRAIKVDGEEVLIDGKEMTEKYQKTYGDNINAMYAALMSEQGFNELPEDQQIDAFKKAKEYATKLAKAAVSDYDEDLPEGDTSDMVKDIMFKTRKSGFNEALLDLADAWDEEEDPAEAIAELDRVYEEFKANVPADKRGWFAEEAGGGIKDYITARKCGVDAAQFADLYRQYKDIDQRSDLSQTQKAEEWASVLQHEKEAGRLKAATVANLKDEMGFYVTFQQEATKYNQMVDDGLTADNADMITHLLDGITGTGKVDKETGEKKILNRDNWRAIAKSGLKDEQLDIAMKAYMDDYDPNAESPDKTELRYDYARQELGLTAEEYVKVITVQQEGGEKAEKIADWRELGFTAQEANMFYRLFAATGRTKIDVEAWAEELYG